MVSSEIKLPYLNTIGLLRAHHLSPKKGLGQNFLVDDSALRQILFAAEIKPEDTVLEVGPGLGHLTRYLAASAGRVAAVEIDIGLFPALREVLAGYSNVELVQGDILEMDLAGLNLPAGYLVVANIPYNITGSLIQYLLEVEVKPARLVLTVQKEVAEAICATPGDLSIRALSVQVYGRPQVTARILAEAFYPPPDVDSAVLRIDLYPQPLIPTAQMADFFRLIKAGFSQKRKTLRNSLAGGLGWKPQRTVALLQDAEIDPQRRAETLSLTEWERIVKEYTKF